MVEPGPNFALVRWDTNLAADSSAEFGLTSQYGDAVADPGLVLQHELLLTGLLPGTEYHFNARSETSMGLTAQTGDSVFTTGLPAALLSDDFNRFNLNRSIWSYVDPHYRGELMMKGAGTDSARGILNVPDNYDYSPENGFLRLAQAMNDISPARFEAKFVNRWTVIDGYGGLFVESGPGTFVLLGFRYDGTDLVLQASEYAGGALLGSQSAFVQAGSWDSNDPLYLRVERMGDQYQSSFSLDGQNWVTGPGASLTGAPNQAGLFAANGAGTDGRFGLATDYLFDLASPLPADDLGVPEDHDDPYLYRYQAQALSDAVIRLRWWTDEATDGELRYGLTPSVMGGVQYLGQANWANELLITGLDPGSAYYLELTAADGRGQTEVLSGVVVTTPALADGIPAARVWNGWDHPTLHINYQTFGLKGNAQDTINVVGRIYDTDEERVDLNDVVTWTLNNGPENTAILGDPRWVDGTGQAPWRLSDEGDFNLVIPVADLDSAPLENGFHKNEVRLEVEDNDGNIGVHTVFVNWKPNTSWPTTYSTDFEAAAMSGKLALQNEVQVIDGAWYLDHMSDLGYTLRTNPKRLGYNRMFAIGEALSNQAWSNYEARIPFAVLGFDIAGYTPGTGSYGFGVINRWNGHQDGGPFVEPKHGIYPLSSMFTYRWFDLAGDEAWQVGIDAGQAVTNFAATPIVPGESYVLKVRVEDQGDGSTLHSMKIWHLGDQEPSEWSFEQSTDAGSGPATGSLAIFAHHVDLVVGDISVTGL